jgi:dienelactone hydrolase
MNDRAETPVGQGRGERDSGPPDRPVSRPDAKRHAQWLRAKRAQLTRLLGGFPARAPLQARTVKTEEREDCVLERVAYQSEPGEAVPAGLLIPRGGTPPYAAVICLHQHAGNYDLGKSESLGLAGDADQAYALELCRRGYVTLAPDAIGFEERREPLKSGAEQERFEAMRLLLQGLTLQGKMVWEVRRAVDYLESRPEVDSTRIGCLGHSLGGIETWFAAALEPRIKVAVASCAISTYAAILKAGILHNFAFYVPGLLRWGDVPEVISLLAPRPLLLLGGKADPLFPAEGFEEACWRAKQTYLRLGAAEKFDSHLAPGGHAFTPAMRSRAYSWFDRWL